MYIITSVLSTKYISRMSPNKANEVEKIISQKFAIFSPRPRITYKRFTSQIYQGKPENKREVVHMFLVCILILLCICRCWLFSQKKIVKHCLIEIPQFSFMINQFFILCFSPEFRCYLQFSPQNTLCIFVNMIDLNPRSLLS